MIAIFLSIVETPNGKALFETIYYNYRNQMRHVANSILHNDSLAEDAVQDALLGIARTVDKVHFDNESKIKSYVLTAAQRAALNIKAEETKIIDGFLSLEPVTPMTIPDISNGVLQKETLKDLINAIQKLPQQYQDVLFFSSVYDMNSTLIADLMNKPRGTIRKQLSRARQMLVEICQKESIEIEL